MTADEVVEEAAKRANAAIVREGRQISYDSSAHEWREGMTRFAIVAVDGEIRYRVPGYEPIRLTHHLASYGEGTVASVTRSVLDALKVDMPSEEELRAEAIERAKRCPGCGADTSLMAPQQTEKLGSSLVQWDVVCPECRQRHWVDVRSRENAHRSPFYHPPIPKRRSR